MPCKWDTADCLTDDHNCTNCQRYHFYDPEGVRRKELYESLLGMDPDLVAHVIKTWTAGNEETKENTLWINQSKQFYNALSNAFKDDPSTHNYVEYIPEEDVSEYTIFALLIALKGVSEHLTSFNGDILDFMAFLQRVVFSCGKPEEAIDK